VSIAGDNEVDVFDYATATRVAQIPVGVHPQRVRFGYVAADVAAGW
jgi:YVTN family beta-propeller protein